MWAGCGPWCLCTGSFGGLHHPSLHDEKKVCVWTSMWGLFRLLSGEEGIFDVIRTCLSSSILEWKVTLLTSACNLCLKKLVKDGSQKRQEFCLGRKN